MNTVGQFPSLPVQKLFSNWLEAGRENRMYFGPSATVDDYFPTATPRRTFDRRNGRDGGFREKLFSLHFY